MCHFMLEGYNAGSHPQTTLSRSSMGSVTLSSLGMATQRHSWWSCRGGTVCATVVV